MKLKSEFLDLLYSRGYFNQCTDLVRLDQLMNSRCIPVYIGFDCTAKSLHIGSLMQIMILRYLQKFGHKPIVLLGNGTTKIGDPSGKDKSRAMLSTSDIAENMLGIRKVLEKFIVFGEGTSDALLVYNAEWLDKLNYIDFLRDIGKHFSVNNMLTFDSVRLRLEREQNLSFLEFNYMLLQAYDFVQLNQRYGCLLQIGGSDQWGNIINGVELGRKLKLPELFGLTTHLLLTNAGEKMGKTAKGAVWLDAEMYDPTDYWQYFRNVKDEDVVRFLRLFTELPIAEIEKLEILKDHEINEAKKILATEATKICHGKEIAENIAYDALKVFECNDHSGLPIFYIGRSEIESGLLLVKLLQVSGLEESNSSARRLISNKGCKINDIVILDINYRLSLKDFCDVPYIKLSCGKKRHLKIVVKNNL
ncbi:tyrosine--tRNA ligase [Ehrlichia ruminantium]|uniref:Tyrosine--tRNA ligase n=1 Tax=Ehrlichia ruminantium TaxID=779 RepID=A0AAE6UI67_EHRRU|nr:tyrosine--tRNA ligase [Ehrlichia ruminantium]QGR02149.1 tyrosine--tRNA ligase [Ehrlichia ruminantium]QGR03070.1 tyrosine--tRNA ligase [Ehrlichia ruminantium]QGR03995.1 tyrosine--tRNA ligase [Ehrlichia ruminantium]